MIVRRVLLAALVTLVLLADRAGAQVAGGDVVAFGAPDHGSTEGVVLASPIVDIAGTPDSSGYWLVASDGGVFAFGGAPFAGSLGDVALNRPITGMAPTATGRGYWLVAADGGVFAFGDAAYLGSTGASPPPAAVVGIASATAGYWLVTAGGQVVPFGAAPHLGDLAEAPPPAPVVGMAATPAGDGYWLATADGGVYTFGAAAFHGALAGQRLDEPVTGIERGPAGGYWLVTADGAVHAFGAPFAGSAANRCKDAVHGIAARPAGGYWLGTTPLLPASIPPGTHPLDALDLEHRQLESLLRLRQGCQPGSAPRRGALQHPLAGARQTSPYGSRTHPIHRRQQFHRGTDFAGPPTARAAGSGTVVEVRERAGYGLTVVVDHGQGVATVYSHLARPAVSSGQAVAVGDPIGTVGSTGYATGDHLHFEVRVHGVPTDPLAWL